MRVLVTGGAGFIGSNFVRYMLQKYPEYEIVNLDKLTYAGRTKNLADIEDNEKYTFIKGDICNSEDVEKATDGCELVVNFAAESHVDRSIEDASAFVRTNFEGVRVMLESAMKQNVKKFIQIGTDEVYGSIEESSSTENDLVKPRNPYSAAKAAADLLALSYFNTYEMPVIVTRSSNNYGPYQFPEKLIPKFVTNLLHGKKVPIYGDGLNVRDWLYVMDNCEAIDVCLHNGKNGEIYNIGGGNEVSNLDITERILNELGKGKEMIEYVEDRKGHDRRYSLDSGKIEKELGWKPKKNFEEGIKETVKWYVENEKWWKPLV